jgi:hypothetical protein
MAKIQETIIDLTEFTLLKEFNRFSQTDTWLRLLRSAVWKESGRACVFGGALRDLMIHHEGASPRDIDVVVESREIVDKFREYPFKKTSVSSTGMGGVRLTHRAGHVCDVWLLATTFAFTCSSELRVEYSELPKTTFLNTEAVAVVLGASDGEPVVYEHGFFDALRTRTVEINFEENPNELGCLTRALVTAHRCKFDIGPKLVRYIVEKSSKNSVADIMDFQFTHYGEEVCSKEVVSLMVDRACKHVQLSDGDVRPLAAARELTVVNG